MSPHSYEEEAFVLVPLPFLSAFLPVQRRVGGKEAGDEGTCNCFLIDDMEPAWHDVYVFFLTNLLGREAA